MQQVLKNNDKVFGPKEPFEKSGAADMWSSLLVTALTGAVVTQVYSRAQRLPTRASIAALFNGMGFL